MARERKTSTSTRRTPTARSSRTTSTRLDRAESTSEARASRTGEDATTRRSRRGAASQGGAADAVRRNFTIKRALVIVVALAVIVFAFRLCSSAMGVQVIINGNQYTLRGEKTVNTAAAECGIPLNPGDLISIRGNVLTRHAGHFSTTFGDSFAFQKAFGFFFLRYFSCHPLSEHSENQLQIIHVIAKVLVFLGQSFKLFVF